MVWWLRPHPAGGGPFNELGLYRLFSLYVECPEGSRSVHLFGRSPCWIGGSDLRVGLRNHWRRLLNRSSVFLSVGRISPQKNWVVLRFRLVELVLGFSEWFPWWWCVRVRVIHSIRFNLVAQGDQVLQGRECPMTLHTTPRTAPTRARDLADSKSILVNIPFHGYFQNVRIYHTQLLLVSKIFQTI